MNILSHALSAINQPAFVTTDAGNVACGNPAFYDAMDLAGDEQLGACWRDSLSADEAEGWDRGVASRRGFAGSVCLGTQASIWQYTASPVLDGANGAPWLITLTAERGVEQQDLNVVRLSLNAALKAGRMGLWEWDRQTGLARWSPELYDLLRLPQGTGVEQGDRFLQMVRPEDAAALSEAVATAETTGRIDPVVFRVAVGDGSVRWIMACAQATRDAGQPVSRLVGVNVDVTDTIEAERRLSAARRDTERQQQVMQAVLEHAPIGIAVMFNGETDLAYVSRFGVEMMKAPNRDGNQWDAWQVYHLDGKTPARKEQMALHRATLGEVIRNEEWFIRAYDGSLLPVTSNAGPITAADGTVIGGTVVWNDVTSFKEAARQRELFLAAVSHELRTPLSAIVAWTDTLMRAGANGNLLERGLPAIARNAKTQARLIDDLLDFSRMQAGKLSMSQKRLDLVTVLRESVDTVGPSAQAAQVSLTVDVQQDPPVIVVADELRLQQAIWNLLTNAVKFSRVGGLVEVQLRVKERHAEILVQDHGVGISANDVTRVFDYFWQSEQGSSRQGGLGLGLAISRHIVEGHGGSLVASSEGLGFGATFTVQLPLAL